MPTSSLGVVPASFLVFESGLDYLGLGATAGALNPLDVCNTSRLSGLLATASLLLEGVRLHLGIYIYHCALVLKFLCIDDVLKRNQNWVNDERIGM